MAARKASAHLQGIGVAVGRALGRGLLDYFVNLRRQVRPAGADQRHRLREVLVHEAGDGSYRGMVSPPVRVS